MRLNKILISVILVFTYCFSFINVYASEDNIYTLTEEEFRMEEEKEIAKMKAMFNNKRESYTYDYRKVGSPVISGYSAYKDAYNQPPGGVIFPNDKSGFFGVDSNNSPGTFSFGISIAGKFLSVSAAYTPGAVSGGGGHYVGITASQVGKAVRLKVARNYKVQRYDIYRKPQYSGSWTYQSSYGVTTKYSFKFKVYRC